MTRRRALIGLFLLSPIVLGGKCGDDDSPPPDDLVPTDLVPPEVTLQVISIDPASGTTGTPFSAQVYGAEFEDGASVRIGNAVAPKVGFLNENSLRVTVPAMGEGFYDVTVTNPDGEKAVLRRGVAISGDAIGASCRHMVVYFDFDSSDLRADSAATLAGQADCFASSRGGLRVEGHCDERGTTEYNIALGERRAHAVQRYLVSQGVSPGRISTVSYGEERPATSGSTESAWERNRRVEISLQD
jgi:peptidoglycan-associated lipoprotein